MTQHSLTGNDAMHPSTPLLGLVLLLLGGPLACDSGPVEPTGVPAPSSQPPTSDPEPAGSEHIYIAMADGAVMARLATGGGPAWSPDGQRIAFQSQYGIHVINSDGSNNTLVAKGGRPSWSPDGTQIVFASSEGISIMNVDGSGLRTIVPRDFNEKTYKPWDMGVGNPAWSPDGLRIAFLHLGDGETQPAQAFIVNADGSNRRLLTSTIDGGRFAKSDPSWSPDGTRIVYWLWRHGIAVINADGGFPTPIYSNGDIAYGSKPVWSPDGSFIAFNYGRHSTATPSVWIMSATGKGAKLLIANAYDAAWSPDGSRIAFVSTRSP